MNLGGILLLVLAIKFFFFSRIKKKRNTEKKLQLKARAGLEIEGKIIRSTQMLGHITTMARRTPSI